MTGTSTAAIVASAVAAGRPMGDVVKLLRDNGREIFPHRIKSTPIAVWRMFVGGRYVREGAVLRAAAIWVLKNATMLDLIEKRGISISIAAAAISSHRSWVPRRPRPTSPRFRIELERRLSAIHSPPSRYCGKASGGYKPFWANRSKRGMRC